MTSTPSPDAFLAIVNPAAGGGRCGRRAGAALDRLRRSGLKVEERRTREPREALGMTQDGHAEGYRRFLAVGGDGTAWEVLNGLMPLDSETATPRASLGILPLGTGNSFLRDFSSQPAEHSLRALVEGRRRRCDVLAFHHSEGVSYCINLLGFGLATEVTRHALRYKWGGALGYVLAVLRSLAQAPALQLPYRVDGGALLDGPTSMVCLCNSRYTAGAMLIAPRAEVDDGRLDLLRVEPLGRLSILRLFPRIFGGTHVEHPAVRVDSPSRVDFEAPGPGWVMMDGELARLTPHSVEVRPGALELWA